MCHFLVFSRPQLLICATARDYLNLRLLISSDSDVYEMRNLLGSGQGLGPAFQDSCLLNGLSRRNFRLWPHRCRETQPEVAASRRAEGEMTPTPPFFCLPSRNKSPQKRPLRTVFVLSVGVITTLSVCYYRIYCI